MTQLYGPSDDRHGTLRGYDLGCRKDCCLLVRRAFMRERSARPVECSACGAVVRYDKLSKHRRKVHFLGCD